VTTALARVRSASLATAISVATLVAAAACKDRGANRPSSSAPAETEAQVMDRGLNLLYQRGDPIGAEAAFRDVLSRNPMHYGAQYQLAVALDRGGRPGDARSAWETVLRNAEASRDTATLRTARRRLALPDTASQAAMMVLGLDLLYRRNEPAAAAEQFRKVLQRNPTHYGATYQLAAALDKSGQAAQARPVWEKVLGMATVYRDSQTATTARNRLSATR
jgi:Tfp pilus assembly protein PilF